MPFGLSPLELSLVMLSRKCMDRDGDQPHDLVSAFPNLHTLELHGDPAIRTEAVARLPPTITRLDVTGVAWNDSAFSSLPRGLVYLRAGDTATVTEDGFLGLPQTLRVLNLANYVATERCWQHLPTNIEKFICASPVMIVTEGAERTNNSSMWFTRAPTPLDVCSLPYSLITMDCTVAVVKKSQAELVEKLPKTITRLKLRRLHALDRSLVRALPRALKCFCATIQLSENMDLEYIHEDDWPRALEFLTIDFTEADPTTWFFTLPSSLTGLECGSGFSMALLAPTVLKMPVRLTFLRLAKATGISRHFPASLPTCLEQLFLQRLDSDFGNEMLALIAQQLGQQSRLNTLLLEGAMIVNDETISLVPRSVTDLHIAVNDRNLSDVLEKSWVSAMALKNLPREIKQLQLFPICWSETLQNLPISPPSNDTRPETRSELRLILTVSRSDVIFRLASRKSDVIFAPLSALFSGLLTRYALVKGDQLKEIHIMEAIPNSHKKVKPSSKRIKDNFYRQDDDYSL